MRIDVSSSVRVDADLLGRWFCLWVLLSLGLIITSFNLKESIDRENQFSQIFIEKSSYGQFTNHR